MVCNKCGMQNNDNSKFCINCGNVLLNNNVQTNNNVSNVATNNEGVSQINTINQSNSIMQSSESTNVNIGVTKSTNNLNQTPSVNTGVIQPNNSVVGQSINNTNNDKKEKASFKLNKKMLFIIGGVVLVLIIIVIIIIVFGGSKKSTDIVSLLDLESPIPVSKDDGYVYINTKGKITKNVNYLKATEFVGDYAYVELQDGTSALIDKSQNVKVTANGFSAMEYISQTNSWLIDGVLYNSKLKPITDEKIEVQNADDSYFTYNKKDFSEYGIMDINGKIIYKNKSLIYGFEVDDYVTEEDYAVILVQEGSKYKEYLISLEDGTVVYESKYKSDTRIYSNSIREEYSGNGIFYIEDDNYDRVETFYVKDNKILYSLKGDIYDVELYGTNYIELDYGYDYEELGKEQRYYYYDLKNKKLLTVEPELEEPEIEEVDFDITQRQIVSCSNGKGLIDDKKVIIPCMYDDIDYLPVLIHDYMEQKKSKDLLYVEKDDKTFIYDGKSKKEYLKFQDVDNYTISDSEDSIFVIQKMYIDDPDSYSDKLNKQVVYNIITKKSIEFDSKSDITLKTHYFKETKDGKTMYYNSSLEKIYTE